MTSHFQIPSFLKSNEVHNLRSGKPSIATILEITAGSVMSTATFFKRYVNVLREEDEYAPSSHEEVDAVASCSSADLCCFLLRCACKPQVAPPLYFRFFWQR